ncbi:hypothetical protein BASA81_005889 [Batrachochytrium salamandrivorans]|nr:hypothetical protein BASA81_005889 [Batrachochytrium salamandrivorans]
MELAFEYANQGCDLEQAGRQSKRLGKPKEASKLLKQASERYSNSIQLLLEIKPTASLGSRKLGVVNGMIEFLLKRMAAVLSAPKLTKYCVAQIAPVQGKFAVPATATTANNAPPPVLDEKRRRVVDEIVQTEYTYNTQLGRMIREFQRPLLENNTLTEEEDAVCFCGVVQIHELSTRMLATLQGKVEAWDASTSTIGDTFLLYASFFKMYMPFANNFERGQQVLMEKGNEVIPVELQSLRIMPIQRVPRYVLLIKELLKHTPSTHVDYLLLTKSLEQVIQVASQINTRLQSSQLEAKVFEIQSSLWSATVTIPELVSPGRQFRRQGPIAKLRSNGQVKRNYFLFAFNDIVVYTTTNPVFRNKYHFHNALDFYGAFPCDEEVPNGKMKFGECAFKITGSNGYRVFIANSESERTQWLDALQSSANEKEEKRRSWGRARGDQQNLTSPLHQWLVDEDDNE